MSNFQLNNVNHFGRNNIPPPVVHCQDVSKSRHKNIRDHVEQGIIDLQTRIDEFAVDLTKIKKDWLQVKEVEESFPLSEGKRLVSEIAELSNRMDTILLQKKTSEVHRHEFVQLQQQVASLLREKRDSVLERVQSDMKSKGRKLSQTTAKPNKLAAFRQIVDRKRDQEKKENEKAAAYKNPCKRITTQPKKIICGKSLLRSEESGGSHNKVCEAVEFRPMVSESDNNMNMRDDELPSTSASVSKESEIESDLKLSSTDEEKEKEENKPANDEENEMVSDEEDEMDYKAKFLRTQRKLRMLEACVKKTKPIERGSKPKMWRPIQATPSSIEEEERMDVIREEIAATMTDGLMKQRGQKLSDSDEDM